MLIIHEWSMMAVSHTDADCKTCRRVMMGFKESVSIRYHSTICCKVCLVIMTVWYKAINQNGSVCDTVNMNKRSVCVGD